MDKNKLYRIEVLMHQNLPEIDTTGTLLTNDGYAFVKLHPVRITAKPKIDAVEVVRCKDCKQYHKTEREQKLEIGWCGKWRNIMRYCDFCSFGERKDND